MSEHGGNVYSFKNMKCRIIDFSSNINPFGISSNVKKAIINAIDSLESYPDTHYTELKHSLAEFHGVNTESIVCGNGGADIIYRLVHAVKPHKAIIPSPAFSEYEKALEESGCDIISYNTDRDDFTIKSDIIDMMDKDTDFMAICTPANPTGVLTGKSLLLEIAEKALHNNTILLIDECFMDMTDEPEKYTMLDTINRFRNIFILKSMTKMYAVPGLRLGYGISSDTGLTEKVSECGQPWAVNNIAVSAGIEMIKDNEYRNRFRNYLISERMFLYTELRKLGFKVFKPTANYVFFYTDINVDLYTELIKYGILIRKCDNYRYLSYGYYRIAVKLHEDNVYLIETMKKITETRI